jgi:hypothetical protein
MYARLDVAEWPVGQKWSVLLSYCQELRRMTSQYSLQVEALMFATRLTPEHQPRHQFVLIKWNRDPSIGPATNREVLGVYTDIDEAIGVMKLLVADAKERVHGVQK